MAFFVYLDNTRFGNWLNTQCRRIPSVLELSDFAPAYGVEKDMFAADVCHKLKF